MLTFKEVYNKPIDIGHLQPQEAGEFELEINKGRLVLYSQHLHKWLGVHEDSLNYIRLDTQS